MPPAPSISSAPSASSQHRLRQGLSFGLLALWLATAGWGFWLLEGRPAFARAQSASDPIRVQAIEAWGRSLGAGQSARPLLILLPTTSATLCACPPTPEQLTRLHDQAELAGLQVASVDLAQQPAQVLNLLPTHVDIALFSRSGRLLFAGPAESPLHCSQGASLGELVLTRAHGEQPPLWAPVLDEPCPCANAA
jgi:hypothetical protein